jgi:hypothetical protein
MKFFKLVAIIFLPVSVFAVGGGSNFLDILQKSPRNIMMGPIQFHPGARVQSLMDDNLYNRPSNKTNDFIHTFTPGLLFGVGRDYIGQVGYAMDYNLYQKQSKEDFVAHHGLFTTELNFPSRLYIRINDDFLKTKLPRDRVDNPLRAEYMLNTASTNIGFNTFSNKISGDASFVHTLMQFDQTKLKTLNRTSLSPGMSFNYRFLSKTTWLVRYAFGMLQYPERKVAVLDNTSQIISSGLKFDFTSKVIATVVAGYHIKDMENKKYIDQRIGLIAGDLIYQAPIFNKTDIDFKFNRDIFNSTYRGTTKYSPSAFFIQTGGGISTNTYITHKLAFKINFAYNYRDYVKLKKKGKQRVDNVIAAGPGLTYYITRWMMANFNYGFTNISSNDKIRSHTNNQIILRVAAIF